VKSIRASKAFCNLPGFIETFLEAKIVNNAISKTLTPHEIKIGTENDNPKISTTFGVASMFLISPPLHQIKN
jgi:cell shape-determining protein mreB